MSSDCGADTAPSDLVLEVLELLHNSHRHARTVQCRYVFNQLAPAVPDWDLRFSENPVDDCVIMDVPLRSQRDPEVGLGGSKMVAWDAEQMRIRVDVISANGDLERVDLADPTHWLRWQQRRGTQFRLFARAREAGAAVAELYAAHLDAAPLCARYRFGRADESWWAGRRAVRARATELDAGAAAWTDLWIDRDHGTILRRSQYQGGLVIREMKAVEVEFDARIAGERWSFPGAP